MVYKGPSRACFRCRQMKKKCDLIRPQCTRCVESGVQCEGYRSGFDLKYRDENEKTRMRAIAPKSTSLSAGIKIQSKQNLKTLTTRKSSSRISAPISISPLSGQLSPTPPENPHHLLQCFHEQFVLPAQLCKWPGWLSRLPENYNYNLLLDSKKKNSSLKPAFLAASHATIARKENTERNLILAREFYGDALKRVAEDLKCGKYDEDTAMSIALLDIVQWVIEEESENFGSHSAGLRVVLEMQRHKLKSPSNINQQDLSPEPKKLCDGDGNSIFEFMPRIQKLLSELRERQPPSENSKIWVKSLNHEFAGARAADTFVQIAEIAGKARPICAGARTNKQMTDAEEYLKALDLVSLVNDAQLVDETVQSWWIHPGTKWDVIRRTSSMGKDPSQISLLSVYAYDCYHDIWTACVWNTYRAARVILQDAIIECIGVLMGLRTYNSFGENLIPAKNQGEEIIELLVQDVRASVPFILGQVGEDGRLREDGEATGLSGQSLMWPLNIIHQCVSADLSHRTWAADMLLETGKRTGIRRAWVLARRSIVMGHSG